MTGTPETGIDETTLLAYADGRLDAAARLRVERLLAQNPERAAEMIHWQRQNEALRALYGLAPDGVPPALDPVRIARGVTVRRQGRWRYAVAALLLLTFGAGLGWAGNSLFSAQPGPADRLLAAAVTAHTLYVNERRHAVEVAGSDREHLLTWLSNRIETPLAAPDLGDLGFTLMGGRLLPPSPDAGTGPAAQLMYEKDGAERLTLYVTGALPDRGGPAYLTRAAAGLDARYWATDTVTCTIVGPLSEPEMDLVARRIYAQLTRRPDTGYEF